MSRNPPATSSRPSYPGAGGAIPHPLRISFSGAPCEATKRGTPICNGIRGPSSNRQPTQGVIASSSTASSGDLDMGTDYRFPRVTPIKFQHLTQTATRNRTPTETRPAPAATDEDDCSCEEIPLENMAICNIEFCPRKWYHWECVNFAVEESGRWTCPGCDIEKTMVRKVYHPDWVRP